MDWRRTLSTTGERRAKPWPVDAAELDELQGLRLVGAASTTPPRSGERPSHRFGLGYDFADFHRYQPGDRVQHIDWTRYCLTAGRQVYVRKYHEELSADHAVILDASASMDAFADDDKLATALHTAFLLLYAATGRYETAGLTVLGGRGDSRGEETVSPRGDSRREETVSPRGDSRGEETVSPRGDSRGEETVWPGLAGDAAVEDLEAELAETRANGRESIELLLSDRHAPPSHLGSIVLLSDLFVAAGTLARVLDALAARTRRLHVVQFIGALDRRPFKTAQDVEWYDAETGERVRVHYDPQSHGQRVDELVDTARSLSENVGASYLVVECPVRGTGQDLVDALVEGEVLEEA